MDDCDPCRVSYFQGSISKFKRFTGKLSRFLNTMFQMYLLAAQPNYLLPVQIAKFFFHILDGSAELYFPREIKALDFYSTIKPKMLDEYR